MVDTLEAPTLGLEERTPDQRVRDVVRRLRFTTPGIVSNFTPDEVLRFADRHPQYDYLLGLTYVRTSGRPSDALILRTRRRIGPMTPEEVFEVKKEMQRRLVEENPLGLVVIREGSLSFDPGRTIREREVITPFPATFEAMEHAVKIPGYEFVPQVSPSVRVGSTT